MRDVREGTPRWSPVGASVPIEWFRLVLFDREPGPWHALPNRKGAAQVDGAYWWPITPEGAALLDLHLAGARLR